MYREFVCNPREPIVTTALGKIHGFKMDGLYQFRGIRYATAERFMMPKPVEPWDGVVTAWAYGPTCPTNNPNTPGIQFVSDYRFWPEDENCQYLNIWTPTTDNTAKKPVVVWIHGGAHEQGSPISRRCYDCADMSANGDMVVVSLAHRLNILGYLDLSEFGEEYKDCVNVGIYDIIEALRWVKKNIEAFGGDAENVTIMGHSGGGEKVTTLLQMPDAAGLFNKAVVLSGVFNSNPIDRAASTKIVHAIMEELGVNSIPALQAVPAQTAIDAFNRVKPSLIEQGIPTFFGPIAGKNYPGSAREVGFSETAKTVPLLIGTVMCEFPLNNSVSDKYLRSDEEKRQILASYYGEEHVDELIAMFHEAFPEKDIGDLRTYDTLFRTPMLDYVNKMAAATQTPIYTFLFTTEFPFDGGRAAWHGSELPFIFGNAHKFPLYGGFAESEKLERIMNTALVNFAHNGNPNGGVVPQWAPYCAETKTTMVFDKVSGARDCLDHRLQEAIGHYAPNTSVSQLSLGKKEHIDSAAV